VSVKALRNAVLIALKAAVSGLLLAFVFRKAGLQNVLAHLREMDLRFFVLSSLVYLLALYLAAVRWSVLLGGRCSVARLYSLTLIGAFFNNLLPGSVGGDAVKTYYLYRDTGKGGTSIASVFLDRYVGYAGLLCIGLVSGLLAFRDLAAVGMQWISPLLFAAFVTGSLVIFGMRIGRRFSTLADFYDFFHDRVRDRRAMATALLLSLAVQGLAILMVWLISRGLDQRPSFAALFVFVPIIFTVMMVPLSISGLGIREGAFVLLFGLTGITAEASTSISFLWFLSIAAASLTGLVEYLRHRTRSPGKPQPSA
jgi:uncharacterized protein (TIRG00374 family)